MTNQQKPSLAKVAKSARRFLNSPTVRPWLGAGYSWTGRDLFRPLWDVIELYDSETRRVPAGAHA